MLKTLNILLITVMLGAAAYTYQIKHTAELIETEVTKLDRKIALEKETISLLQADWTLLDQPSRLQRLADVYAGDLELQPIRPEQIIEADQLPAPRALPLPALPTDGRYASNGGPAAR